MSIFYKEGENKKQQLLFPQSIDEYVSEDNQVRAIEDYVELLDMLNLGFSNSSIKSLDGQPPYHPKLLLKIYLYGYLNKIRSSRKLEAEIKRNVELMWLCAGLKPSYKTIANFRKDNSQALKKVFREFVLLCKELNLITGELVAVDGAFLRANASKNQLIMKKSVERDLKAIDEKVENYLKKMEFTDTQDKKERALKPLPTNNLPKIVKRKEKLDKDLALLEELGLTQYNRTDPDAKCMVKPAHNLMAYNSQIVVDDKFKFIVATDVSSNGNDTQQLHKMAVMTKENLKVDTIEMVGDTGYYSSKEFKKCSDDNIDIIVPKAKTKQSKESKDKYTRDAFKYNQELDCYICPNKQELKKRPKPQLKNNQRNFIYAGASKICKSCPLKDKCIPTTASYKQIYRYEFEHIIEEHKIKMQTDRAKALVKKRGSIVEHPFGTIKRNLGWDHFLVRGTEKVSGENALIMFSYNFTRLLNLIGIALFRKLIIAIKDGNIEQIKEEIALYITHYLTYMRIFFIFHILADFSKIYEIKKSSLSNY